MKAVAAMHQTTIGAASMRLTRLKKALGDATDQKEVDDDNGDSAAGGITEPPKTPKVKALKPNPVGVPNTNSTKTPFSTPTPTAKAKGKSKSKKRKLNEEEQADGLFQRAGIEALTHEDMDPEVGIAQLKDVMLQTNDEGLKAECERKISVKEAGLM